MDWIEQAKEMLISYAPLVAGAILTLVIGFILAGIISRMARKAMEKRDFDASLTPFITSLINITIKILVLLSAASMFGFEVTSFVAILGALAFAIGMALQGNLSHMAAGIMILFFRPFRVGDFIVTQGYSGTVKEIQIFNTILTTLDNRVIIIPNGAITSGPLENLTANPERKVPMTFGISYRGDIDKARSVIQQVADGCEHILHDQPVDIFIESLGSSSVNFTVRPWCKSEHYWDVFFYMHEQVKKAFDANSISIPFPQMDVHVQQN
ncbi:MAG: mechanosensitive ion channel [Chitinophagales bacterium]|nr:mechanosensitive ion channel [Chitinophagales bacterium]MCB9022826.1 mechanosensitive ion channel [Chitinophagales bacterium]HAE14382.1 mechanosensitive ion channel protein [Bacteroidota bacterium]HPE98779.1 mechanosensitive ion channel [Chitinophagales bacterium]HQU40353.1 mechanosensitive ion channel [Chitinophagales bacterium]